MGELPQDSLLRDSLRVASQPEGPRDVGWETGMAACGSPSWPEGSLLLYVQSWFWQGPAICGALRSLECL